MTFTISVQCPRCGRAQKVIVDGEKTPYVFDGVRQMVMELHYQSFHPRKTFSADELRVGVERGES